MGSLGKMCKKCTADQKQKNDGNSPTVPTLIRDGGVALPTIVVLPKSGSVQFFEDFHEPGTGPMVRFRQMSEPWTRP